MANTPDDPLTAALAEWGVLPQRQGLLQQQMQMAQQLRNTPMPQGRDLGRVFVASSPLENAATALQRTMGMKQAQGIQGQQAGLIDREQALRAPYLQELQKRYQEDEDFRRQVWAHLRGGQAQPYRAGTFDVPSASDLPPG